MNRQKRDAGRRRLGSILVLAAVFLVVIFAFAAFTVDVGYISLARTQMQASADAAALAGVQQLNDGQAAVHDAAKDVGAQNLIGQQPTQIVPDEDVEIGIWDDTTRTFTPLLGNAQDIADSVRVTVKLDATRENALPLFFAPLMGFRNTGIKVQSVASKGNPKPRDIMLVIDCSGSMDDNNRMPYTRQAALVLANELGQYDRLGLTVYSYTEIIDNGIPQWYRDLSRKNQRKKKYRERMEEERYEERLTGFLERPLSFDLGTTRSRVSQLYPAMYDQYTNIGGGIRVGIEELIANDRDDQRFEVEKILVLMTDGHANRTEPPAADPVASIEYYAQMAADNDIIIHGITLGEDAAKTPIRNAADGTGGMYFHVNDGDFSGLFEVYESIGKGIEHPKLVQ